MRVAVLALVVSNVLGAAPPPPEEAVRRELRKLEGTWVPTAVATDKGPLPLSSTKVEKIVLKGDRFVMHEQGKQYQYTFTINPEKKPKQMDIRWTHNGETFTALAIYELEGEVLKFANGGKERPAGFKKLPAGGVLFVHKRVKP